MKAKTKRTRLFGILLALVMVVGLLPTVALAEEIDAFLQFADAPGEFFYNNSGSNDSEGPTVDTTFTLTEPTMITGIWTYHWYAANYDIDFSRQTIQLKDTNTNTVVYSGAVRVGHYFNTRDCDWVVLPNILLPAGTYQVIDSHNESWSTLNSKGVCMVKGYSGAPSATALFSTSPIGALALLNNAKTGTEDSTWDSDTNTLTLNGVNFETSAAIAVKLPADSKIVLNGVNTIKGGDSGSDSCYGIFAMNSLTIEGTGTLTVTGGTADKLSIGIYAQQGVNITGGKVKAIGGTVTNGTSSGIYANNVVIEKTSNSSPDVTTIGGEADTSYGINATGSVAINGGTLVAKAVDSAINKTPSTLPGAYHWRTSESGGYSVFPGSTYTWGMAHTYLEIREPGYTVTFDSNGGSGTMTDITDVLGDYTLPANGFTAPEGKQFKCWSVDGNEKAVGDKITVTADTTVTAVWENITYTISFDANGGDGTMADVAGVMGEYTLPENGFTAPEGKQFKCWSVDGNEKAVGDKITVTADTAVTAVWETIPDAPTEYDILDGANSSWTQNSDGSLSVKGSGAFSEFVGVKVDGTLVDAKNYTVKEGSTIVTLKADYLNTCTVGSHTLEIVWTDGSASTTFTVNAKAAVNNDTQSSQTGDNSMMGLWIALLFVSGAGVLGTAVFSKKKKRSAR